MYDIIIIGAGPAGATLARLAGNRHRVLLADRHPFPASGTHPARGKCCGGLLAPDAQSMLARMGFGVPHQVLAGPQIFAVRAIDIPGGIERFYQRHYINIDREKFDRWLLSMVPSGVDMRFGCRFKAAETVSGGITVRFSAEGRDFTERCRVLVGADGASSPVRSCTGAAFTCKTYIALQQWFRAEHPLPYYSAIFDGDITDFYSWTIPKDGTLILGAALPPRNRVHERFELLKTRLQGLGFDFSSPLKKNSALLLRPVHPGQTAVGAGNIVLIGEAGGWISPSSAEGISYALRTAMILSGVLETSLDGVARRYRSRMAGLTTNIMVKNMKSPFMYAPLLRRTIMKSGVMSLKTL